MPSRTDELMGMAEECRALAATIDDKTVRAQLMAVAEHFERLAASHHPLSILESFRGGRDRE